jgi:hypothetical protein
MPASRRFAFATAMGVIHRVHCHASHRWANTAPTFGARLTQGSQVVFTVADFTEGGATFRKHSAHLS